MPASYERHRGQIEAILLAWGMTRANAAGTADVMAWADLHGIDSHGISMLPAYEKMLKEGRMNTEAVPRIVRETPVSALVDGENGLGHVPSLFAMRTAIAKAGQNGLAAVVVQNSAHFGACGYYSMMAADAGLVGIVATSASGVRVAPAGGAAARLGTDPWSFAAPGEPGRPFLLDMATTTAAYGRVRNKANEGLQAPPGWLLTKDGVPTTDPLDVAERHGFLTALGGTLENASYKGYGLAMMVNILAAALSGMTLPSDPDHARRPDGMKIGHFFLALDPGLFREPAVFRADVARFCDAMRATPPADPGQPVQVAGDPERARAALRRQAGIPVGQGLLAQVRAIADAAGAPWTLD
jgi:LDH2 family malate/lactate/ureidoglycolate dehydrogenase